MIVENGEVKEINVDESGKLEKSDAKTLLSKLKGGSSTNSSG